MLRCLIVDDSEHFLGAARRMLEREGVSVVGVASSGAQAIERARALRPDVILVDVDLGPESGFDVVRRLAEDAAGSAARLILISSYPEADVAELAGASVAAGYLSKLRLSAAAIRAALERADERPPE
jgi:DNA-binding NarL/FixJ family response regulator